MPEYQQDSPQWWRDELLKKLAEQATRVGKFEKYYEGEHPLPTPPERLDPAVFKEACRAFDNLSRLGLTNWVKLVPDAPAERLAVIGFRSGDQPAGDADAWAIWQKAQLDADSALVHDSALQTGQAYVLVWGDADGEPVITCEHPSQVIVAYAPGSRRLRVAALKSWQDEKDRFVVLYRRDGIYKWRAPLNKFTTKGAVSFEGTKWEQWRPLSDPAWPVPNPLNVVPVIEFRANPSLKACPYGGGRSEMEFVLPIQDRINKTVFDRLVTAEHQAFRQRYAIGWEPPIDETTGKPDKRYLFRASQASIWTIDADPNAVKLGDFEQASFEPFIKANEADVTAMAAISKTPPHYLLGSMVNISGDALVAAESGLVAKTAKHRDQFSESWEEVMRLALLVKKDKRAQDQQSMVLWRPIEFRTMGEQVDAILKMKTLGVPDEALWLMLPGTTPQDVERWKAMRAEQPAPPPEPPVPVV